MQPGAANRRAYSQRITAGLAAASTRWRDRRLAVAELRRRGVERGALRRRNTTDTHSRLKPLLYVLLTLSYKLALIAIRSALCTLHSAHLSLHTSHRQRRPAERKFEGASSLKFHGLITGFRHSGGQKGQIRHLGGHLFIWGVKGEKNSTNGGSKELPLDSHST